MRYCPFCAAENGDDASHCVSCAKKLPPVRKKQQPVSRPIPVQQPVVPAPVAQDEPTPTPTVVEPRPVLPTGHVVGVSSTLPLTKEAQQAVLAAKKIEAKPEPVVDLGLEPVEEFVEPPTVVDKPPDKAIALREPSQRIETHKGAKLVPMPDPPETGFLAYARYALAVWRGRYDRRVAARELGQEIKADVASLDGVLGALGREVRAQGIVVPGLAEELRLIQEAEARRVLAEQVGDEIREKTAEENTKFQTTKERFLEKIAAGEKAVEDAGEALEAEEGKRKALREKRKELERRYRDLLKRGAERDAQADKQTDDQQRRALRGSAEEHRREAKGLEPERVELDRQIAAAERPIEEARGRLAQAKTDVQDTKQALEDVEAGHRQRLTELAAETSHQQGEAGSSRSEVARRTVTLGTLVNLHRLDRPPLKPHYARVDELKVSLATKESEIERLAIERNQIDRAAMVRGIALIAGAFVLLATVLTVLVAVV